MKEEGAERGVSPKTTDAAQDLSPGPSSVTSGATDILYCKQAKTLLEALGQCIHELTVLNAEQFRAVVQGDLHTQRFDDLIHSASQRKNAAKCAYLEHLSTHGCSMYRREAEAQG